MSDETTLPIHPRTGLQAIGMGKRGPIWPIFGASEDHTGDAGGDGEAGGAAGGDVETPTAPADLGDEPGGGDWWKFTSKEDAIAWGNKTVTERLKRERERKLDPITAERDTLKAEVDRLRPFEEAALTDAEKRDRADAITVAELTELREFRANTERAAMINTLADEVGLDPKFLQFVVTDGDEATVRANMSDLLNALSESGKNTGKATPGSKAPQEPGTGPSGSLSPGGGGGDGDESDDAVAASIIDQIRENRKRGGLLVTKR